MGNRRFEKLPSGFRFFFSKKEIKAIEKENNILFSLWCGGVGYNTHFNEDQSIQSCFEPVFLTGQNDENGFKVSLFMSGFRNELLPKELEEQAKGLVKSCILNYIQELLNLKVTDLKRIRYLRPELQISNRTVRIVLK
ncbi:hypothetical protein ACFQ4C_02295 [Larkinella insperata]|uniref:Uncharacterized protein n=1 Tax=Larkinella insperata TaxID=332158 RepID=A0ABW3Q168_9BACT|nr:hypothetical protein [Larkinella insperata]